MDIVIDEIVIALVMLLGWMIYIIAKGKSGG